MAATPIGREPNSSATKISAGPFNSVVFRVGGAALVVIILALLAFKMFEPNLHGPAAERPPVHPSTETYPSNSGPAVAPAPNK